LQVLGKDNKQVIFTQDASLAAKDSDCLITDTWFSMGSKKNKLLERYFLPYQINKNTLKLASKKVVFMHCLPAKRGKEVTNDIIDNKNISIVWDEAENRLHVQKAILEWCLKKI
jgi:ornithine carbamoyltransferase